MIRLSGKPSRIGSGIASVAGIALFAAAWEVIGRVGPFGASWPPLSEVAAAIADPERRTRCLHALQITLGRAALGYLMGVVSATVAALVASLSSRLEPGISGLAALINGLPSLAIAPVLVVVLPDQTLTPPSLAALSVFFTSFAATLSGLRASRARHRDLLQVLGSTRVQRLLMLDAPCAVPGIVDGLRLGVPAAMLGTITGEWFGSDNGIGLQLIVAMQNYRYDTLWAVAVLAATVTLIAYGVLTACSGAAVRRFR